METNQLIQIATVKDPTESEVIDCVQKMMFTYRNSLYKEGVKMDKDTLQGYVSEATTYIIDGKTISALNTIGLFYNHLESIRRAGK